MWWAAWFVMVCVRVVVLARLVAAGGAVANVVFVCEAVALWFGVANAAVARVRDRRGVGCLLPAAYLGQVAVAPPSVECGLVAAAVIVAGSVVRVVALVYLQGRFSLGAASWVGLQESGPYRFVRHPQEAGRMGIAVGLLMCAEGPLAVGLGLISVALAVAAVSVEESFLSQFGPWRRYRRRVLWRVVPGLW